MTDIQKALEAWDQGQLVSIPTETVYGLAAPLDQPKLIQKIFALKKRPRDHPLIVHVSSLEMAKRFVPNMREHHTKLANHFWPGALTMLMPSTEHIPKEVIGKSSLVGMRMPSHPLTLSLIQAIDQPIVAPSANPFQQVSPTHAKHVRSYFDANDVFVLDGGPCQKGIESTIIELSPPYLIQHRPGVITTSSILEVLGNDWTLQSNASVESVPGNMPIHYRPPYQLVVGIGTFSLRDAVTKLATSESKLKKGLVITLPDEAEQASRMLYSVLLHVPSDVDHALLLLPPHASKDPAWEAIMDRLTKASVAILS